jgi:hypothetical protein
MNSPNFTALMNRCHIPRFEPDVIVCDPDTYEDMKAAIVNASDGQVIVMPAPIFGMRIYKRSIGKVFTPPKDRFIEYEEKDLPWLEKLGIGKYCEIRYSATMKESAFSRLFYIAERHDHDTDTTQAHEDNPAVP